MKYQMTRKAYNFFVGIDISKEHLDYAVLQNNSLIKQGCCQNSAEGIATIISYVKTLSRYAIAKCLFCMEHTGLYTFPLIDYLSKIKARYVVENPLRLKRTLGIVRGKTDQKDAYRIAQYAYKHQHEINCHVELRPPLRKLGLLIMLRNKLSLLNLSIKIPFKERRGILDSALMRQFDQLTKGSLKAVKIALENVEKEIDDLISEDLELKRLMAIVLSVPQIGRVTGIHIILATNEFKNINCPKKFASYAGVAPFPNQSGSIKRPSRVSPLANKKMKVLLHICALGAIRNVPEIKAYYLRKTEKEGKTKMSVINAVRYKLICRVFSCIRQNRKYISNFQSPLVTHD